MTINSPMHLRLSEYRVLIYAKFLDLKYLNMSVKCPKKIALLNKRNPKN